MTLHPCLVYNNPMTDANMPWSLKGISDEARDYAREASDDSGLSTGAWLSAVINAAALQEQSASAPVTDVADDMLANIDHAAPTRPAARRGDGSNANTIERAVQIVSDFGFEPEGPARDEDLIEDTDLIEAELDALERRLADTGNQTSETIGPLVAEIERLRQRLEALRSS